MKTKKLTQSGEYHFIVNKVVGKRPKQGRCGYIFYVELSVNSGPLTGEVISVSYCIKLNDSFLMSKNCKSFSKLIQHLSPAHPNFDVEFDAVGIELLNSLINKEFIGKVKISKKEGTGLHSVKLTVGE